MQLKQRVVVMAVFHHQTSEQLVAVVANPVAWKKDLIEVPANTESTTQRQAPQGSHNRAGTQPLVRESRN